MKTLIIIDVQNDFLPGGALAVPGGDSILPVINQILPEFGLVVATQDWHPPQHKSFASAHTGKKPFEQIMLNGLEQTLWPDHCVQETKGADFAPQLNTNRIEAIFRKGTNPELDSYSGFFDNGHLKSTGLAGYLRERQATELYFCGLAGDICVYYSLKDALKEGFTAYLLQQAVQPLNEKDFEKVKKELVQRGAVVV